MYFTNFELINLLYNHTFTQIVTRGHNWAFLYILTFAQITNICFAYLLRKNTTSINQMGRHIIVFNHILLKDSAFP
jgi:hypothetical protein